MVLRATEEQQTISLLGDAALQYKDGSPSVRRADSCFYELASAALDDALKAQPNLRLYVQVTKSSQMNVYLYGGKTRGAATELIVNENEAAVIGKNYTIDISKGMLLVAYPNKDQVTEFEFKYWIAPYNKTVLDLALALDFDGPMG